MSVSTLALTCCQSTKTGVKGILNQWKIKYWGGVQSELILV